MNRTVLGFAAAVALGASMWLGTTQPAAAVTMKECSTLYQSAQKAGTLNGMKWNDFRKAKCGSATDAAAPAAASPVAASPKAPSSAAAAAPVVSTAGAVFPRAVSPQYSKETAGKARMHTCLDQYNANKSGSGNGGLKWIQKGGGYYSECNKRLKS